MVSMNSCPGFKNSSYDHVNLPLFRIVLHNDCKWILSLVMNSIINAIKRPYNLTFHDNFDLVFDDLVNNRSDICANHNHINYHKHEIMKISPPLGYSNAISILGGKIYQNSYNDFNDFNSFPLELWTIFGSALLMVAIVSEVILMESFFRFSTVNRIMRNLFTLIMQFFTQSQQYFSRICCIKHILIKSTTLISVTLMTLFFNSKFSSDLIHNPLLRIDSLDDLAQFITNHPDVEIIADNRTVTWKLLMEWQGKKAEIIRSKLKGLFTFKHNYHHVYHGKTLIIGQDGVFQHMVQVNPDLKFHISNNRHYGSQFGLLYSKNINNEVKMIVDSVCMAIFESGLINSYQEARKHHPSLNINEFDYFHQDISINMLGWLIYLLMYCLISLVFILLMEIIMSKISFIKKLNKS